MQKSHRYKQGLVLILFLIYLMFLLYLLFFSEKYGRTTEHREYQYNLQLFHEIQRFLQYWKVIGLKNVVINLVGNILAFVPFGLFLPILGEKSKKLIPIIFTSFAFSFSVEVAQLVTKVGAFDVDDIILNTLGGMVGFGIYCIFNRTKRAKES